jgi:hypothetical protein
LDVDRLEIGVAVPVVQHVAVAVHEKYALLFGDLAIVGIPS